MVTSKLMLEKTSRYCSKKPTTFAHNITQRLALNMRASNELPTSHQNLLRVTLLSNVMHVDIIWFSFIKIGHIL